MTRCERQHSTLARSICLADRNPESHHGRATVAKRQKRPRDDPESVSRIASAKGDKDTHAGKGTTRALGSHMSLGGDLSSLYFSVRSGILGIRVPADRPPSQPRWSTHGFPGVERDRY